MELIDRDELIRFIDCGHLRSPTEKCFSELDVVNMLKMRDKVDAVPVVRCKDCKDFMFNNDEKYGLCVFYDGFTHKAMPDDFCSYGDGKGKQ